MNMTVTRLFSAIFSLLLLLAGGGLFTPSAHAQMATSGSEPAVKVGVRGGLSQASLNGNGVNSSDARSGFTGGIFATIKVGDALSFQPELLYSAGGATDASLETAAPTDDASVRNDFLRIPVLVKLDAPIESVTPRLYVGPSVGILLNSEIDGEDRSGDFSGPSVGAVIGGEIAFDIDQIGGLDEITLDGRYTQGLADIAGDTRNVVFGVRPNAFTGTVSLAFDL
jgi:hypothetical protein